MRLCPAVGLFLPLSQKPPESSGAALPAREGVKSFFWLLLGDCASRSSTAQTPAARANPQRLADRLRGRPQAKASALPTAIRRPDSHETPTGDHWLAVFRVGENIGVGFVRSHKLTIIPPAPHALLMSSMFPLGILNCAATFSSADSTVSPCFL